MAQAPLICVIVDGLGLSPLTEGNAVMAAATPFLDWAVAQAPHALLHASGAEVGLDWGEMGNSEVGHLNIGTGRVVMQDLPRINRSINDKSFFTNLVLLELAKMVRSKKSTLHIIGLASSGGVHGHLDHLLAMVDFAKYQKLDRVALHLIADGRDSQPTAFDRDVQMITSKLEATDLGTVASLSGRYYAMDRDKRWDRTQKAYGAMVRGDGRRAGSLVEALSLARDGKETDEFIIPTVVCDAKGKPLAPIEAGDVVVCTTYRPDRARQLAASLTAEQFTEFPRSQGPVRLFVSFASYGQEATSAVKVAFFAPPVSHQLAEEVAAKKLTQFHLAETEKYAHVTYFLNGGREEPFPLEERCLIPSPKVATYDLAPEMSAKHITAALLKRLKTAPPALTIVNYANPDMVGHTGNMQATIKAIATIDQELLAIYRATQALRATLLVTADHGNAEQLIHPETHEIDKEHTTNPVPLFFLPPTLPYRASVDAGKVKHIQFAAQPPIGVLADIAPTLLDLLKLEKPQAMTGQSLKGLM